MFSNKQQKLENYPKNINRTTKCQKIKKIQ